MAVVGSPPSASFCAGTTWGTLKLTKVDTCSKVAGRVFSEPAEAPQAITTRRTVLGDPETAKIY